jgi:hypothetical protein
VRAPRSALAAGCALIALAAGCAAPVGCRLGARSYLLGGEDAARNALVEALRAACAETKPWEELKRAVVRREAPGIAPERVPLFIEREDEDWGEWEFLAIGERDVPPTETHAQVGAFTRADIAAAWLVLGVRFRLHPAATRLLLVQVRVAGVEHDLCLRGPFLRAVRERLENLLLDFARQRELSVEPLPAG